MTKAESKLVTSILERLTEVKIKQVSYIVEPFDEGKSFNVKISQTDSNNVAFFYDSLQPIFQRLGFSYYACVEGNAIVLNVF